MTSLADIRSTFLNYFGKHDHEIVSSSPLVPRNDPTLMFTNSGMVQFKNLFTGVEHRDYTRASTSQKRMDKLRGDLAAQFLEQQKAEYERRMRELETELTRFKQRNLTLLPEGQPEAHAGLGPKDPLEKVSPEITFWSVDTLIVGHLPYLGRLASLLLASDPDRPLLAFQPGSRGCLEKDAKGQWVLAWIVRPELLAPGRG